MNKKNKLKRTITKRENRLSPSNISEIISKEIGEKKASLSVKDLLENKVNLLYEKLNEIGEIGQVDLSKLELSNVKAIGTNVKTAFRSLQECKQTLHSIEMLTLQFDKRKKSVGLLLENINRYKLLVDDYISKLNNIDNKLADFVKKSFAIREFLIVIFFLFLHLFLSAWLYRGGYIIPFCVSILFGTYFFWKICSLVSDKLIGLLVIGRLKGNRHKFSGMLLISPATIVSLLIFYPNNFIVPKYEAFEAKLASRVRIGPGLNFAKISTLGKKEKITVLGREGSWSRVRFDHKEGYIYSRNLQYVGSRNKKALFNLLYFLIGGTSLFCFLIMLRWAYLVYFLPWLRLRMDKKVIQMEIDTLDWVRRLEEMRDTLKIDLTVENSKIKEDLIVKIMQTYKKDYNEIGKSKIISTKEKNNLRNELRKNTISAIRSFAVQE